MIIPQPQFPAPQQGTLRVGKSPCSFKKFVDLPTPIMTKAHGRETSLNGVDEHKKIFRSLYKEIAQANQSASKPKTAPVEHENKNQLKKLESEKLENKPKEFQEKNDADSSILLEKKPSDAVVTEASSIIRDSLAEISNILGIELPLEICALSVDSVNATELQQFSEVLATLKGILQALGEAVKTNTPVVLRNNTLSGDQIAMAEKSIKMATFRIEVAFQMVGITPYVNSGSSDNGAVLANLPFAIDPASKTMSLVDIEQLFKNSPLCEELGEEPSIEDLLAVFRKKAEALLSAPLQNIQAQSDIQIKASNESVLADLKTLSVHTPLTASASSENILAEQSAAKLLAKAETTLLKTAHNLSEIKTEPITVTVVDKQIESKVIFSAAKVAPLPSTPDEAVVMRQIIEKVSTSLRNGVHEMRLTLRPEALGEVQIKIQVHGEVVTTRMHVESLQIKQILEANAQQLKDALSQHNLQSGSLEVSVGHRDAQSDGNAQWSDSSGTKEKNSLDDANFSSDNNASGEVSSIETGRRFGKNSVEYFA